MNKEDIRQKMLDIVGDIYHAKFVEHGLNGYTKFDGHTWQEANDTINTAFDRITIDHPKVKLPREVGEELDDWKFRWGIDVGEYLASIYTSGEDTPKAQEWREDGVTVTRSTQLSEAFNHGWEAEPEELFYVKTPEAWESEDGDFGWLYKSIYGGVDTTSHGDGKENEQFTRAEIKQYHLDSDIFTLVPVENEEVSR